jgi:hypothetical protein
MTNPALFKLPQLVYSQQDREEARKDEIRQLFAINKNSGGLMSVDTAMLLHSLKIKESTKVGKLPCIIITEVERDQLCGYIEECDASVKAAKNCEMKALAEVGKMHLIAQEVAALKSEQERSITELKSLRGLKKARGAKIGWSFKRIDEDLWQALDKDGAVLASGESFDILLKNLTDATFENVYGEAK